MMGMESVAILKDKLGSKWKILKETHDTIMSAGSHISFRIFPIYIRYTKWDKIFAIVYFKGKFAPDDTIDVGLSLRNKPAHPDFVTAQYMKSPEITFSIKISEANCSKAVGLLKETLKDEC